jgi:hypothetical protein
VVSIELMVPGQVPTRVCSTGLARSRPVFSFWPARLRLASA